ncbi:MAG: choice-of-anchor D domain-containing protein [Candidatus Binatus sp.]|jgi:sugar lactone lactonase YvrE|uniref:choice-of-anchor D domain-containing protein n=1 Tax=Candidatus Binatus sp. TaxID=2811406 RepID=UPI003D0A780F
MKAPWGKVRIGMVAIFCAAALAIAGLHRFSVRAYGGAPNPILFVTDGTTIAVTAYSAISGYASPLAPAPTGLALPGWVAVDASGKTYVTNAVGTITIYAAGSNGDTAPIAIIGGSNTGLISPQGIAVDSTGKIYVVDNVAASVFVYSAGSNGNVAPIATISGIATDLSSPEGIALDSSNNMYVTDQGGTLPSVFVFSAGSSGNAAPVATISGPATNLDSPYGIALDSSRKIYVADTSDSVFVYPAVGSSTGTLNEAPTTTISGSSTELATPKGIALDSSDDIYVGNYGPWTVTIYSAGSSGDAAPIATISGNNTDLANPEGVALDSGGNIYAADGDTANSVTIYPPLGSSGWAAGSPTTYSVAPKAAISTVLTTGLINPQGIALDSSGKIYVADKDAPGVFVYPAGSNGNAAPIATISGGSTGLNTPQGIALDSSADIYVADEGDGGCDGTASVLVYSAGSTGDAVPMATISGEATGLCGPAGIALDFTGNIYVVDERAASVFVYSAGSSGDTPPIATISGGSTGLRCPVGITLDSSSNIYVTDDCAASVFVYPPPGSPGNTYPDQPPSATISGGTTGLEGPYGIALDSGGNIYVADNDAISVFVYPPLASLGSSYSGSPTDTVSGPLTELYDPLFVAIPPGISPLQVLPYGIVFGYSIVLNSGTTPTPPRLVKVTNQSGGSITIGQVTVSPSQFWIPASGEYSDKCSSKTLQPGASCTVGVNFAATAVGTFTGTLTVPSDAPNSPNVTSLRGVGVPGLINLSPALSFPNTLVGHQSTTVKTATLTNPNTVAMTVDSITPSSGFGIVRSTGANPCNLSGSTILHPKGTTDSSCTVGVTFTPTAQGTRTGSLTITSNAKNSPATIVLKGTGTLLAPTFSPKSFAFGTVTVGNHPSISVTVTNPNTVGPIAFASATIDGNTAFTTSTDTCSGHSIAAGDTCTIGVTFTPTATTGSASATVIITDNAATFTQKLAMSGKGKN